MWKPTTETTGLDILVQIILVLKQSFEDVLKTKTDQEKKWGHEVGAEGSPEELVSQLLSEVTDTVLERVEHHIRTTRDAENLQNIRDTEDMIVEYEGAEARIKVEVPENDMTPTTEPNTYIISGDCTDIEQLIDTNELLILESWGNHVDGQETTLYEQDNNIDYTDDLDSLRMCMEESMDIYLRDNGKRPETEDNDTDYKTETDNDSDKEDKKERRHKRRRKTERKDKGQGKRTKH